MNIPLVDLAAQHAEVADEVDVGAARFRHRSVHRRQGGARVRAGYAEFIDVTHCGELPMALMRSSSRYER